MAEVYMKDKPEADSFSYAYVEDVEGKLVRISVEKMREVLGITKASFTAEITLKADGWILSEDGSYHTQGVIIDGIGINSKIDMQATPQQIIELMNEEVSLMIINDDADVVVYAIGGIPATDLTFDVLVTEVKYS